tara:strand:+ start:8140 stop:8370 length:231 start_codon:yes stop_codon:yes gene_type:complete
MDYIPYTLLIVFTIIAYIICSRAEERGYRRGCYDSNKLPLEKDDKDIKVDTKAPQRKKGKKMTIKRLGEPPIEIDI